MQRVFLLTCGALFGEGVEQLLRNEAGIEIVGRAQELDGAIPRIRHLAPDVVVAEEEHSVAGVGTLFARLLDAGLATTLVSLGLGSNRMTICRKEQHVVQSVEDLMNAIRTTQEQDQNGVSNCAGQTGPTGDGEKWPSRPKDDARAGDNCAIAPLAGTAPAAATGGPATSTRVNERIKAEPAYRELLFKLLAFCTVPRSGQEIHDWMLPQPEMQIALHTPAMLLNWMVRAGGIEAIGAPAQEQEPRWQTSEAGRQAVNQNGPTKRMDGLLSKEPVYGPVYRQILGFCVSPRSRAEIEALLSGNPVLDRPAILPSYLIEQLESAGGLEWTGKWQTTLAGKGVMG